MQKNSLLTRDHSLLQGSMEDIKRRRALGIYYTPPDAAKVLARWAIREKNETVLEPSFGGCAMLSAAVSVFDILGNGNPSKQLYGYDVDSNAFVHLAQMGLDNSQGNFKKQDFLQSNPKDIYVDAVLANPPFVSYQNLSETQRQLTEKLRNKYLPQLPKRASLWAYFLLHSLSFLRENGRMAFVLPNSIVSADYAQPLMNFLCHRFSQVELLHVTEQLFIQAGADERISLLLLSGYISNGISAPTPVRSKHIMSIGEIIVTEESSVQLTETTKILDVRDSAAATLANFDDSALNKIGSIASVHIGEVVGDIRFFVRPLSEWVERKINIEYLEPLLTRAAQIRGIYIPKISNQNKTSKVPYLLLPPEINAQKAIRDYLKEYPEHAILENRTFEKRPLWFRCSYSTEADAFIGSMSHDYPRIIGNNGRISCSNSFNKITLRNHSDWAAWLPIFGLTTPLRLSAEILGRIRGSGGIKLEPSDVKRLCIPAKIPTLPKTELTALRKKLSALVCQGELDAASQLADAQVFLEPRLIDAKTLSKLRIMRLSLTNQRLSKNHRND